MLQKGIKNEEISSCQTDIVAKQRPESVYSRPSYTIYLEGYRLIHMYKDKQNTGCLA